MRASLRADRLPQIFDSVSHEAVPPPQEPVSSQASAEAREFTISPAQILAMALACLDAQTIADCYDRDVSIEEKRRHGQQ